MTNIKFKVFLKIFFLKLNNVNISFDKKILIQRFFIINKILATIKFIYIINKIDFIIIILDINSEIFIIHIAIQ